MTKATPATPTNKVRQPTCKVCKKRFRTTVPNKLYCSPACSRQVANNKRPKVDRIEKARRSAPFYRLVLEVQRAGTLEILRGHTAETLLAVFKLQSQSFKFNEYGQQRLYELSHIAAANAPHIVGLYRVENLVIAPRGLNNDHGTSHFGHGVWITRASLNPKHNVHERERDSDVLDRILAYLGDDLVNEVVKRGNIQPTQRFKLLAWLEAFIEVHPEHSHHSDGLPAMSTVALGKLKSQLQCKDAGPFKLITREMHPLEVLSLELSRHAQIRPSLAPLAAFIAECVVSINHREPFLIESPLLQLLFDVLMGKELEDVASELTPVLETMKAMGKLAHPVPVLSLPIPAVTAPKVLMRFQSFADEVDYDMQGDALNDAPVMLQSRPEPVCDDPVPW